MEKDIEEKFKDIETKLSGLEYTLTNIHSAILQGHSDYIGNIIKLDENIKKYLEKLLTDIKA